MNNTQTCYLEEPVSQCAFSMVNVSDNAEISYSWCWELRHLNVILQENATQLFFIIIIDTL